jgi:transposase
VGKYWPVSELLQMIIYKGEEAGMKVECVSSYKTSQTCSRCGVIKENFTFKDRIEKGMPIFVCDDCGFQDNADYNAAKNIAKSTLITK